jgi:hypothetical protein
MLGFLNQTYTGLTEMAVRQISTICLFTEFMQSGASYNLNKYVGFSQPNLHLVNRAILLKEMLWDQLVDLAIGKDDIQLTEYFHAL